MLSDQFAELIKTLNSIPKEENSLFMDVHQELGDSEYAHLRHGTRHTRNQGCTGPLCTKALRDWQRGRAAQAHALAGTIPRTYRRSTRLVAIDALLGPIKAAHDKEFDARRESDPGALQTAGLSKAS